MNTKSMKILVCATLVSLLSACGSAKEGGKIDRVRLTETQKKGMGGFRLSCAQAEDSQDFSKVNPASVVSLAGITDTQQIELINCRGEIQELGMMDLRSFQNSFFISPEVKLEKVHFVKIKNTRTCSEIKIEISKTEDEAKKVSERDSVLFPNNELRLVYSTNKVQSKRSLNVIDGKNLVEVEFHGDCKESREKGKAVRENLAKQDCTGSELLSSQQLVIDVSLKRTTTSGVRQIDICSKN